MDFVKGVGRGVSEGGRGGGGGGGGGGGICGGGGFLDWRGDFIVFDFSLLFKGEGSSEVSLADFFLPKLNFFVFLEDELKSVVGVFLLKGTASVGGMACFIDLVVGVVLVLGIASLVRVVLTGSGANSTAGGGGLLLDDFLMRSRTLFGGKTLVFVSLWDTR